MKKNQKMSNQFQIKAKPGIDINDISISDIVEFTDPLSHGRHFNQVLSISDRGKIIVKDAVGDKTNLGIRHIRRIYKLNPASRKHEIIPLREV